MKSKADKSFYSGLYISTREKLAFVVFWVFYFSGIILCAILLYLLSKP